jgi:hypothetical protein
VLAAWTAPASVLPKHHYSRSLAALLRWMDDQQSMIASATLPLA